jgi:hypothetical protein
VHGGIRRPYFARASSRPATSTYKLQPGFLELQAAQRLKQGTGRCWQLPQFMRDLEPSQLWP